VTVRGFIVQPTYRIEGGRAVVHLYGRLESGKTFLVRDGRQAPHFYVRAADAERAGSLGAAPLAETAKTTMSGEPVVRVEVPTPPDTPAVRDTLIGAGIPCYEADVRFAMRYLIDRGIRGSVTIEGKPHGGDGIDAVYDDPKVTPADWMPKLSVLSFDIETDPKARRLLAISLHGCGASEVLLFTPRGYKCPKGAIPFPHERDLLAAFCRRVRELDPDVLTGWNVIDFDLSVLARMAGKANVPFELGRGPGGVRIQKARSFWGSSSASVPGRVVLDGIDLLRGAFVRMDEYSLDAVAREVLGEGKVIGHAGRAEEILRLFKEDRERFVDYSLTDARLVTEILDKLRLVDLAVERSRLTGMPPDRVAASVASFDFLYLSELARRGIVAPTVRAASEEDGSSAQTTGGHVLEPEPGLYTNALVLDFKSLYPSLIRTFQIDPLGRIHRPGPGDDPITAPNGAAFRREPGILPGLLDELFPRREAAKKKGDSVASHAIKILMNSFYGVLGTPACRFHSADLANAITGFGREMLLWSKGKIEGYGHRVIYGDTDSLFVLSGEDDVAKARNTGERLVKRLNTDLAAHIEKTWRVDSRLELEFETLYLRLLLHAVRHGTAGARKRYAGLVEENGKRRVVFTGMEVVRRDWTDLAKQVQREIYERLFSDRPVEDYLRSVVDDLRAGRLDARLVYRKALRKGLEEYTATTPPHVAAARKMSAPRGRLISYVMTTEGPEPAYEARSPLDHEHYVQKQVRPVAEPVLALLGLDFARVVGDDRQMGLFSDGD
jgi:DNA polymerase-2